MPEEGVPLSPNERLLTTPEILRLARLFAAHGVTKIRLTGGEPTVRLDLLDLVRGLSAIRGISSVCLTSNGIALPRKLDALKEAGLTAVNISLDTLQEGKFMLMTRRKGLAQVRRAIDKAVSLGLKVKVNNVVMHNLNEDEVLDFVRLTRDHNLEVRFIEYMPFDGNKWSSSKMLPTAHLRDHIIQHEGQFTLTPVPSIIGDTANSYTVSDSAAGHVHAGRVGFISSMTDHFCGTCTRLRLTCDGNLKVCLFGEEEVSLRDLLRSGASDDEIMQVVGTAVRGKREKHAGIGELEKGNNRPMILIGG